MTICNENPIQTEFGLNFSRNYFESMNLQIDKIGKDMQEIASYRYVVLTNAKASLGRYPTQIGLTLDDMLFSCFFTNFSCNSSDFEFSYNANYGNCYSFNTGIDPTTGRVTQIGSVTKIGSFNGLWMELYVGAPYSLYALSGVSGLHVYVDHQTVYSSVNEGDYLLKRISA